jgi:2',3'-cyclic-nucleotide 2'-phosphodiesterase (5'-nucleotidase family)
MRIIVASLLLAAGAMASDMPQLPHIKNTPHLGPGTGVTTFTVFVAGDNRPAAGSKLSPAFRAMIKAMAAANTQPALVLWGGDVVKGKSADSAKKQYPAVVNAFLTLKLPVFTVPGNHELDLPGSKGCNDARGNNDELNAYEDAIAAQPYGYFTYGNSAFIGVNTEDALGSSYSPPKGCFNGYVGKGQLSQLKAKIASFQSDKSIQHVFLFMHRPVIDDNHHQMQPDPVDQTTPYGQQVTAFTDYIKSLTTSTKVRIVFASHDHRYYQADAVDGAPAFIVTGGAGAPLAGCPKKGNAGAYYHYLRLDIDGANYKVSVVPLNGTTPCGSP